MVRIYRKRERERLTQYTLWSPLNRQNSAKLASLHSPSLSLSLGVSWLVGCVCDFKRMRKRKER